MVELMPSRDVNDQGALMASRLGLSMLGMIARQRGITPGRYSRRATKETCPMTTPNAPHDAAARRAVEPVMFIRTARWLRRPGALLRRRAGATKTGEVLVQPRDGGCFRVPAGSSISSVEGPQVGDLNLWNANDLGENSSPARRAPSTAPISPLATGCGPTSCLRPMATIIEDTLGWYGIDGFGGGIHM